VQLHRSMVARSLDDTSLMNIMPTKQTPLTPLSSVLGYTSGYVLFIPKSIPIGLRLLSYGSYRYFLLRAKSKALRQINQ
jgi:hypothetical protein